MKISFTRSLCLMTAVLIMIIPLAVSAALPGSGNHKLGARLETIATAAAEHRLEPLMSAALTRELFQQNSPLEARWNAAGQVQVYLHYDADGNPPDNAELMALGASDIVNSPMLKVVQAWIPADKLKEAAALTEVTRVSVPHYAFTRSSPPLVALPRTGSVDTEGDSLLGAQQFRQATGYTGQGMVVGVISNGDSGVSTDQRTSDLPSNIWNDPNNSKFGSSGAEGTAMMEIVYDLAPGVKQLGFCGIGTTTGTTVEFITCLNDFANDINANVIVDDLGFPGEAMFTNGSFANAVQQFATAHPNIHLVTAAGNDATAFWAGQWNAMTITPGITVNKITYTTALDFGGGPTQMTIPVQPGDTISYIVEWNDPWDDSATTSDPNGDYDAVLFNGSGTAIACNQGMNFSTTNGLCNQTNSQPLNTPGPQPVQGNQWQNTGASPVNVYLEIFLVSGTPGPNPGNLGNQFKILIASQKSNQIQITPDTPAGSIYGQSAVGNAEPSTATPGEITVGAVPANDISSIESYSSQGPVQLGIPGTGTGTQPPETIQEPDFVATDCVSVTGVGNFGSPFCGTSAAAPHIAGLLALLISAYPSSDPYTLLQQSSSQLGVGNPNGVYGFGLPNMMTLLAAGTYPATSAAITNPASGASVNSGQGVAFQGSCLGYDGSNVFTYDWNFGSSGVADSSAQNPTVTFNTAGSYTVKLTCTNGAGSGSATSSITVSASRFSGGGGGMDAWVLAGLLLAVGLSLRRRAPGTLHGR